MNLRWSKSDKLSGTKQDKYRTCKNNINFILMLFGFNLNRVYCKTRNVIFGGFENITIW